MQLNCIRYIIALKDRPNTPRAGFTLVELLTVIGIIALLIAILVPALAQARREAQRAYCLSNMRGMQIAQWMYITDHRGWLIQGGMAHGGVHADEELTWFNTLNKYYNGKLAARCPSDNSPHWITPVTGTQLRRTSYGINGFLDRDLCPWGKNFEPAPPGGLYTKIESIRRPAEVIQFVEMAQAGEYAASDHCHPNLFALATTPDAAIPTRIAGQLQVHTHRGKVGWDAMANYGFIDGHAESLPLRTVFNSLYVNRFDPASPQPKP